MSYTSQTFTNGQKLSADPLNKMNAALVDHENNKAGKSEIPTKVSQLTNDSNFITNAVEDLVNYYKKTETYTQEEINQKLSAIPKFSIQPVDSLPTEDISTTTVYLVKSGEESQNLYTEYIYVNGSWEYLGKQTVDLTGYALKTDIPTTLPASDVYSWAKEPTKPTYTADEVGALNASEFTTEMWTFELEDGSSVTKEVVVK